MAIKHEHFSAGHFKLVIDGKQVTAYIKGVEGGLMAAQTVEEPVGQFNLRGRHLATREIEPISIEFGMAGSKWVLDLVDKYITNRLHHRLNGEIIHADANMVAQYIYTFSNAVITEVTLPKLDSSAKETALVKVKLQPQDCTFKLGDGRKLNPDPAKGVQKQWNTSNFRLNFDNGSDATKVNAVESMTVKIGHKAMQQGNQFRPDIVPTKVDMPKLSITLPLLHAGSFIKWYQKAVGNQLASGTPDADTLGTKKGSGGYETSGSIEYLDQTISKTLYTVEMYGIGLEKFSIPKSEANAAGNKLAKFDFYVTDVKIKSNGDGFS